MTLLALALLVGLAGDALPASAPTAEDSPFQFVLNPADVERYRHPGPLPAAGQSGSLELRFQNPGPASRIDVFERASPLLPGWRWSRGALASGDSAELTGKPGAETLIVIRKPGSSEYLLDGPFLWPDGSARHTVAATRFRSLRGSDRTLAGARFQLLGPHSARDALCEVDDKARWQCLGVPSAFASVVALCGSSDTAAFGEVSAAEADVTLQHPAWASAVRLSPADPAEQPGPIEIKLLKPGPGKGQLWEPDPGFKTRELGGGLFWLNGSAPPAEQMVTFRGPAQSSARIPLTTLLASRSCGEAAEIALERNQRIFGTVYDTGGNALSRPMVFVMEEAEPSAASADSGKPSRLHSGVEGDENGRYEFSELGARTYLVRACQGTVGCAETRAAPGPQPLDFRLRGRGVFKGRLLSASGVPEPGASVRVVPTLEQYGSAKEPLKLLPLETRSEVDGRFQIAVPTAGHFMLEARSNETGTARRDLNVTELSSPTDLGDILLPALTEFSAQVPGCNGGTFELLGPVLGPTSLPSRLSFPIEQGRAVVRLPEGGMWLASAICVGVKRTLEPMVLARAEELTGLNIAFSLVDNQRTDPRP
jgi:hypothetical protein